MFENLVGNFHLVQKMMKDENFKVLMRHPKFYGLISDAEFQAALKSKDTVKISGHPKFKAMIEDPELKEIMTKIDFKNLFGS